MKPFNYILPLIAMFLLSCGAEKNARGCNKESITAISDRVLRRAGYDIATMKAEVKEDDSSYLVIYMPASMSIRGGGAEITITKKDCKVTDTKFFQ